jgi:hypothetical protein
MRVLRGFIWCRRAFRNIWLVTGSSLSFVRATLVADFVVSVSQPRRMSWDCVFTCLERRTPFLVHGCKVPSNFFLQLRGPPTVLTREFLHNLTTARHFTLLFRNMHNKKIPAARQPLSASGSISVTARPSTRAV